MGEERSSRRGVGVIGIAREGEDRRLRIRRGGGRVRRRAGAGTREREEMGRWRRENTISRDKGKGRG